MWHGMALKRFTLHCIGCIALQWHSKWPSQPHLPGIWSEIFQAVLPAQERGFFGLPEVHGLMFAPLMKDMGSGNRPPSIYISPWGLVDPWFLWFQHIPPLHHHFASPARIADWKERHHTPHPQLIHQCHLHKKSISNVGSGIQGTLAKAHAELHGWCDEACQVWPLGEDFIQSKWNCYQ